MRNLPSSDCSTSWPATVASRSANFLNPRLQPFALQVLQGRHGVGHQLIHQVVRSVGESQSMSGFARDLVVVGPFELLADLPGRASATSHDAGFTEISMFPKVWGASGLGYPELINRLIVLALERAAT